MRKRPGAIGFGLCADIIVGIDHLISWRAITYFKIRHRIF